MLFQRAFAKINLGLRVIRKRDDGFHEIETVFHRVNVFDILTVEHSPELSFNCDDPLLQNDENLVLIAAKRLKERLGIAQGAKISLVKRIPYGAGLGGGSADAAATLQMLCRLWQLDPDPLMLAGIAAGIGSDVPYFLGEGSAHATSRGEILSYFELTLPHTILVVAPDIRITTRDAYASVVPGRHEGMDDLRTLFLQHVDQPDLLRNVLHNDFEGPLFLTHPVIARIRQELYDLGADFALLSGSGSAIFALFSNGRLATQAAERFRGRHRTFLTAAGFKPDLRITDRPID